MAEMRLSFTHRFLHLLADFLDVCQLVYRMSDAATLFPVMHMTTDLKKAARALQKTHSKGSALRLGLQGVSLFALNAAIPVLYRMAYLRWWMAAVLLGAAFLLRCGFRACNTARFVSTVRPVRCGLLRGSAAFLTTAALQGALLLLSLLPAAGMAGVTVGAAVHGVPLVSFAALWVGTLLMAAVSAWFFRQSCALLFLLPYLSLDGCPLWESLRRSTAVMARHRKVYLRFQRSFFGWFLLGALLLPLPFALAYWRQSAALFADALLDTAKHSRDFSGFS